MRTDFVKFTQPAVEAPKGEFVCKHVRHFCFGKSIENQGCQVYYEVCRVVLKVPTWFFKP